MSFQTYKRDVNQFETDTKGTLRHWRFYRLANRNWQSKLLGPWKVTQLSWLRQESVKFLPCTTANQPDKQDWLHRSMWISCGSKVLILDWKHYLLKHGSKVGIPIGVRDRMNQSSTQTTPTAKSSALHMTKTLTHCGQQQWQPRWWQRHPSWWQVWRNRH